MKITEKAPQTRMFSLEVSERELQYIEDALDAYARAAESRDEPRPAPVRLHKELVRVMEKREVDVKAVWEE